MKFSETISDYIPRVMQIATKMRIHGEGMQDVVIVEKILRSLTEKYNYIAYSITQSSDIDKMSIDELHSSLIVHELNYIRFHKNSGEEQAFKTTVEERGNTSSASRGRGGARGRGRDRGRQSKETIECYKCKKLGHYRNECPDCEKEANYAETEDGDDTMLLMTEIEDSQASSDDEMLQIVTTEGVETDNDNTKVTDKDNFSVLIDEWMLMTITELQNKGT